MPMMRSVSQSPGCSFQYNIGPPGPLVIFRYEHEHMPPLGCMMMIIIRLVQKKVLFLKKGQSRTGNSMPSTVQYNVQAQQGPTRVVVATYLAC